MLFLHLFFALLSLPNNFATATPAQPRWLAFGDLRGHVESCGCDPLTDLGGLNRLHYFLQLEKKANSPFLLFNLGNNLDSKPHSLKNSTIIRLIDLLQPTASLLNVRELARLDFMKAKKPTARWLLSNRTTSNRWGAKIITTPHAVVLGYTYTAKMTKQVRRFDKKMAAQWRKLLQQHRGKHSYLLFAGTRQDLQAITASVNFNTIIASNTTAFTAAITHQEKLQPQRLRLSIGKRQVHMVPLAGQGVLRGGAMLTNAVEADFGKLLNKKKPASSSQKTPAPALEKLFTAKRVSWLDRNYADEHAAFWQAYQQAVRQKFAAHEQQRRKQLATTNFIGAAACQGCHLEQYQVWKNSAHAHAMQTLLTKKKAQNSECVACHSVGFNSGGYVSMAISPHLAGVQCENCHGARKAHILNPHRKTNTKTPFNCRQCHHPPHTAKFDQHAYWQRIKH